MVSAVVSGGVASGVRLNGNGVGEVIEDLLEVGRLVVGKEEVVGSLLLLGGRLVRLERIVA